ncbi:hypothetical protein ACP4OV_023375 [Aristida adscensionis]
MPPKRGNPPPAAAGAAAAEFEYCELCRRNHDQGRRHRYFPAHRAALAAALSRFRSKLSDLRRAILGASSSTLPPRPSIWCPFCSTDLVGLDTRPACSNAIHHLASGEHLKGVKDFLRKHGGGMDQVDSLRISENEFAKWERACEALNAGEKTEGLIGPTLGSMEDIQNESTTSNLDSFAQINIPSLSNTASYVVMPLQSPTNGAYHPISTACHGASTSGAVLYSAPYGTVGLPVRPWGSAETNEQDELTKSVFHSADPAMRGHQSTILRNGPNPSISCLVHVFCSVYTFAVYDLFLVRFRKVPQSHSGGNLNKGSKANVHTGAPPPWLEASENDPKKLSLRISSLPSSKQSRKLNPKRVGAAWAERRRAEMEMEKRGELVPETSDSSWLPNFGSVWQSGTRKESKKEFEKSHKLHDKKSNHELPLEIKPYVSKRMRVASDKAGQPNLLEQ